MHPELSYTIHVFSQIMTSGKIDYWKAPLSVVRYLKEYQMPMYLTPFELGSTSLRLV